MAKGTRGGRRGASATVQVVTNVDDAVKAMRGIGVNIDTTMERKLKNGKVDGQLVIETANQLVKLENEYGVINDAGGIELISSGRGSYIARVHAGGADALGKNQKLELNTKYYGDATVMEKNVEYSQSTGFLLESDAKMVKTYPVTHEYGHMLHNKVIQNSVANEYAKINADYKNGKITYNQASKRIMDSYNSSLDNLKTQIVNVAIKQNPKMSRGDVLKAMSSYGNTNSAEFFAEAFANANSGKPNIVGKAMQGWLKQGGYK